MTVSKEVSNIFKKKVMRIRPVSEVMLLKQAHIFII